MDTAVADMTAACVRMCELCTGMCGWVGIALGGWMGACVRACVLVLVLVRACVQACDCVVRVFCKHLFNTEYNLS